MKKNSRRLSALVGIVTLKVFCAGLAFANGQLPWLRLSPRPVNDIWINGSPFTFYPVSPPAWSKALNPDAGLQTAEKPDTPRNDNGGMPRPMQLAQRIPYVRSIMESKDRYLHSLDEKLDNPDGRLFFPIMKGSEDQMNRPAQRAAENEKNDKPDSTGQKSERETQERYFIGYRLNQPRKSADENWYLGFGWKSGEGGRKGKMSGNRREKQTVLNQPAESADSETGSAVKTGYNGPVIAVVGQF